MSKVMVKVDSHMSQFIGKNRRVMDKTLNDTGIAILRLSKRQVPHDKGTLQNTGMLKRLSLMHFEVSYNSSGLAPYARRWEYETPKNGFKKNRKTHYLSDPGTMETRPYLMMQRFKRAANDLGIRV